MLDPLTAMGIACNVMQVISFCGETISLAKKIKADGTLDPNLCGYAEQLSTATMRLKQYVGSSEKPLTKDQVELQEAAL